MLNASTRFHIYTPEQTTAAAFPPCFTSCDTIYFLNYILFDLFLTIMIRGCAGGCCLLLLAAILPGAHLHGNDRPTQDGPNSEPPSEINQPPILWPFETTPSVGTYTVENCIKATMGVEYIVLEKKKTWYYNLDRSKVQTHGRCQSDTASLTLMLPDSAATLTFTFKKGKTLNFYVTNVSARLTPRPCIGCPNKNYTASQTFDKLFAAGDGQSFKCSSMKLFSASSELRIKLVRLQVQAFRVPTYVYGEVVDCWGDFEIMLIPVIIGAAVVTLVLTALLTYLLMKGRSRPGYQRI